MVFQRVLNFQPQRRSARAAKKALDPQQRDEERKAQEAAAKAAAIIAWFDKYRKRPAGAATAGQ